MYSKEFKVLEAMLTAIDLISRYGTNINLVLGMNRAVSKEQATVVFTAIYAQAHLQGEYVQILDELMTVFCSRHERIYIPI